MDVAFCFIVTKDLNKEHIWRKWLEQLSELGLKIKIFTHCSNPSQIHSPWLLKTLIPESIPTQWGFIMKPTIALFRHALGSQWACLKTESCVPIISPKKFIELFNKYKNKTFLSYCKIWWDPKIVTRANLGLIPKEYHWAHQQHVIVCQKDLSGIIKFVDENPILTNTIIKGASADESFIAISIYAFNNFENTMNEITTLVDWPRSPDGNHPYTFTRWSEEDKEVVETLKNKHKFYMFLRKIDTNFPDNILLEFIN